MTNFIKRYRFICSIIIITILIVMRDIVGITINSNFFIGVIGLILLFLNSSEKIAMACFIIPFSGTFNTTVIFAIIAFLYILTRFKTLRISYGFLLIILLMAFELAHGFIKPFEIKNWIYYVTTFILLGAVIFDNSIKLDNLLIIKAYIIGMVIFLFLMLYMTTLYFSFNELLENGIRFGDASNIIEQDFDYILTSGINLVSLECIVADALILTLLIKNKLIKPILYVVYVIFITVCGFLTMSKTFLTTLLILIMMLVIVSPHNRLKKSNKRKTIALLILSCTFLLILYPQLIENIIERFYSTTTLLTSRDVIFGEYNNFMYENFYRVLFGVGIQSIRIKANLIHSPHNAIQEVFIAWGIVGIIIILVFAFFYIKQAKNILVKHKLSLFSYVPLLIYIIATQASRIFSRNDVIIILIVIFSSIIHLNEPNIKNNDI